MPHKNFELSQEESKRHKHKAGAVYDTKRVSKNVALALQFDVKERLFVVVILISIFRSY